MENESVFVDHLQRIVKEKQISLTALGKETGVSTATLSRILSGQVNPSFSNMIKIAKALQISLDALAGQKFTVQEVSVDPYFYEKKNVSEQSETQVLASYLLENTDLDAKEAGKLILSAARGIWTESWLDELIETSRKEDVYLVMSAPAGQRKVMVDLAFPSSLFESGSVASLVSVISTAMGGTGAKLIDLHIPSVLMRTFSGPTFDPLFHLKKRQGVFDRPLLSATIRPMAQLDSYLLYGSVHKALAGGVDFTFDPSMMHSVPHLRFYDRVMTIMQAIERAQEDAITHAPSHFINISAATVDEMKERAQTAKRFNIDTVMIDTAAVGWSALQSFVSWAEKHRFIIAATGSRTLQTASMSEQVLAKLLRLSGCHIVSTPSPISGSFSLSRRQVKGILSTLTQTQYIEEDMDLGLVYGQSMHDMCPSIPACGGGHTPWHFPRLIELLGTESMIQCGGTVYAHPEGPLAGAEANLMAITALSDALIQGKNLTLDGKNILKEAAKENKALEVALKKWSEDIFLFGVVGKPKDAPTGAHTVCHTSE